MCMNDLVYSEKPKKYHKMALIDFSEKYQKMALIDFIFPIVP